MKLKTDYQQRKTNKTQILLVKEINKIQRYKTQIIILDLKVDITTDIMINVIAKEYCECITTNLVTYKKCSNSTLKTSSNIEEKNFDRVTSIGH